jgi:hypothetical protein
MEEEVENESCISESKGVVIIHKVCDTGIKICDILIDTLLGALAVAIVMFILGFQP